MPSCRDVVRRDEAGVDRPDRVRIRGAPVRVHRGEIGVGAARVLGRHREASIRGVEIPRAGRVLVILRVVAEREGRRNRGARLRAGKRGPVGQRRPLRDVSQAIARSHAGNATRAVRVGEAVCAVDRKPVERVTDDGRVPGGIGGIEAPRVLMVVVDAARSGMAEARVEARRLDDHGVLMPDVLVVVGIRVERVEDRDAVRPHRDRA